MNDTEIAQVVHAANCELTRLIADPAVPVAPPWPECGAEMQTALIDAVFHQRHYPATSGEESHQRWCAARQGAGWVYGPKKDERARTHPLLVPYDELPASAKRKDALFLAIVGALA